MFSGRSRLFLFLISTQTFLQKRCRLVGRTQEILWVEEDWGSNVTTVTLKSLVRKEQPIRNICMYPLKTLNYTSFY